jgi:hypothetical protein
MSFTDTLFQGPVSALPFAELATGMVQLAVLGAVLMFFRPLLLGIARALVLVVRPRLTKDELAARRKLQGKDVRPAHTDATDVPALGSRP